MSRYRGRRRGVSPLMLLIALVVAIAAVVLIIINLGKDKKPANDDANTPPATGDTTDPGNTDDPNAADPVTPDDTTPTYQKIELQGDQQQYDAVYRVGDTGYEMYSYVDSTAKKYADNVNAVADALAGKANVYMLPIPLSSGICLPDELYGKDIFADQKAAEQKIIGYMKRCWPTVPSMSISAPTITGRPPAPTTPTSSSARPRASPPRPSPAIRWMSMTAFWAPSTGIPTRMPPWEPIPIRWWPIIPSAPRLCWITATARTPA